jgi:hypothetical protein
MEIKIEAVCFSKTLANFTPQGTVPFIVTVMNKKNSATRSEKGQNI